MRGRIPRPNTERGDNMKRYWATCYVGFWVEAENEEEALKEAEKEYQYNNCRPDDIELTLETEED